MDIPKIIQADAIKGFDLAGFMQGQTGSGGYKINLPATDYMKGSQGGYSMLAYPRLTLLNVYDPYSLYTSTFRQAA
ncbi:MAG: hypothetical protein ABIE22_01270 [archaeon]